MPGGLQMDARQLEDALLETITGMRMFSIKGVPHTASFPTALDRLSARAVYVDTFDRLVGEGLQSRDQLRLSAEREGLLDPRRNIAMAALESEASVLRSAREITGSQIQAAEINAELSRIRSAMVELQKEESEFLANSAESKADMASFDFLVSISILVGPEFKTRLWASHEAYLATSDIRAVNICRKAFDELFSGLSDSVMRAVARTEAWRRRWTASKKTGSPPFAGPCSDWDRNKVELCHWSDFYDSVYEYRTPPPEHIINDDESLFEWIRDTNRLNKSKAEQATAKKGGGATKRVGTPYRVRTPEKKKE
jgi:hypothetical protein